MSKITISFESSVKSMAEVIPAMTKLLAPAPLNFTIEESADQAAAKRAPKPAAAKPAAPVASTDTDAEKKAQAKREAAKRFAEKKKAEKAAAAEAEEKPAEEKPAKPANKKADKADDGKITMTTLRAAAAKLPKTKLVPVLEELGVTKLTELPEEDFEKALAAFEAANG